MTAETVRGRVAQKVRDTGANNVASIIDAALASLADPEVVAGVAEVLAEHVTTLVACAGHIAGFECSCGTESDHGWSEEGARLRARLHQAQAVVEWITGGAS